MCRTELKGGKEGETTHQTLGGLSFQVWTKNPGWESTNESNSEVMTKKRRKNC